MKNKNILLDYLPMISEFNYKNYFTFFQHNAKYYELFAIDEEMKSIHFESLKIKNNI